MMMEFQPYSDWLIALTDPHSWTWTHLVFVAGVSLLCCCWLARVGFDDWLIARRKKFVEGQQAARKRQKAQQLRIQEELRQRDEEKKRQREAEKTTFYERRRTRKETQLELRIYQRDLERSMSYAIRDQVERVFPNLSREEIQQRIDFLELEPFQEEKEQAAAPKQAERPSAVPNAERRIAFGEQCDAHKETQILDFKKKNSLIDIPESQYTMAQRQEFKRIVTYWNDRKHNGPPKGWSEDERE